MSAAWQGSPDTRQGQPRYEVRVSDMEARGARGQYLEAACQGAPDTRPEGALMIKNSSSASARARARDKRAYNYRRCAFIEGAYIERDMLSAQIRRARATRERVLIARVRVRVKVRN